MVGYKALNADMRSNYGNMQYELGKWYEAQGRLIPDQNGLHFSDTLEMTKTGMFAWLQGKNQPKQNFRKKIRKNFKKNVQSCKKIS